MSYTQPFLRLVLSGVLYEVERFSYSLALIPDFSATPTAPTEVPAAIITACTTFHSAAGVSTQRAKLDTIKLNLIGTDGRYVDQGETVMHEFETPVSGASSNFPAPQVALAVTLRTALSRGRAHVGRFYIPAPAATLDSDGQMSAAQAGTVATAATAFLNSLNAWSVDWVAGVTSNVGAGYDNAVTYVEVGRTLDTIRSRRRSIPEEPVAGGPITGDGQP